ncbi:MAG: acyl-CoA thioesterase [Deinococcales bacterium]
MSQSVKQCQTRFRVRYAETDAMGIAHHSNFVVWLEMGRVEFLTQLGLPYREVEQRGVLLVVSGVAIKYRYPVLFDEELLITTRVGALKSRMVRFEYAIERVSDGALVAEGSSEHIATDLDKRAIPIPQYLRDLLE